LSSKWENIEDDFPSRSDIFSFLITKGGDAHDYVFFDLFLSVVEVGEHDSFKGFKEHLLVTEILPLFFFKELVG
jgi:hypothetical protein